MLATGRNLILRREVADPVTVHDRLVLCAMRGNRQATSIFARHRWKQHAIRVWISKIVVTVLASLCQV